MSVFLSLCGCSRIKSLISPSVSKTFSYPVKELPEQIDPQIADDEASLTVIENCMEGLVRINSEGKAVPGIAEKWDISSDGKTYTFYLRTDAVWNYTESNAEIAGENFNTSITANDFVFAVRRAVKKTTSAPDFQSVSVVKNAVRINSGAAELSSLGIRAVDDYTLKITLENKASGFLESLACSVFMPCSEVFFEACGGRYGRSSSYFLSNAGFALSYWDEEKLIFEKNPNYNGPNPAKPESVTVYKDENAFDSFNDGNYDAIPVTDDKISFVLGNEDLKVQSYDDTVWSLCMNNRNTYCKSMDFRKALMSACGDVAEGKPEWTETAQGIVPNICLSGSLNYREQAGRAKFFTNDNSFAVQSYEKALVDLDTDKSNIVFICTEEFDYSAKLIVQQWQRCFGAPFGAEIKTLNLNELMESVESGNYDIAIYPVSASSNDTLIYLKNFANDNFLGFSSASYNKKFSSSDSELNICIKCENQLLSSALIRPLYTSKSYYAQRNNVDGIYFYAFGGRVNFLNAERVEN